MQRITLCTLLALIVLAAVLGGCASTPAAGAPSARGDGTWYGGD